MKSLFIINDPPYGTERLYNALRLAHALAKKSAKGRVLLCGICMDARGLGDSEIMGGARRSTMDELAVATVEADKVLGF